MSPAPFHLAGERLLLDPSGALFWPARRLLAVADLHLEKGSHFAARGGRFVPPYDTRETLARLAPLLRRYRPARLVALGDSFHDAEGHARLAPADAALLRRLLDGADVVWVLGNHDPVAPEGLPGQAVAEWQEGPTAIAALFPRGARLFLLGRDRLYSLPAPPAPRRPATGATGTAPP
jgi:DNA ligase-associated metallophosphoesterase